MATSSYEQTLRAASALSQEEQARLVQQLTHDQTDETQRLASIMELCGLGEEVWQSQDAQNYVDGERVSWNG